MTIRELIEWADSYSFSDSVTFLTEGKKADVELSDPGLENEPTVYIVQAEELAKQFRSSLKETGLTIEESTPDKERI